VDVQASLLELTVGTVADHCRRSLAAEVFICGGGAANPLMMSHLQEALADVPVRTTSSLGMDPQGVEATAFAWLAHQRIQRLPGSLPSVTGARGPRVLGALHISGS
jgi:anhydro-N-acetylmuramic acid kinase